MLFSFLYPIGFGFWPPVAEGLMGAFWTRNWQYLVTTAIIVVGGGWTIFSYFTTRRDELAWKRTEVLFDIAKYVETDPDIGETLLMLEGRDSVSIAAIVGAATQTDFKLLKRLQSLDKTLNVFDRLSYAVFDSRTFTVQEISIFAWYLNVISDDSILRQYCRDNGFGDVLRLAEAVDPSPSLRFESRHGSPGETIVGDSTDASR